MFIVKFPPTRHIEGSRHQMGDSPDDVKIAEIADDHSVSEEKIDGANAAVSFDRDATLYLQSRGHFLSGGGRERHFSLFKTWANTHSSRFYDALGSRYRMYGEWVFAKHTIYYDALTAYFFEFDVLDTQTGDFLSTDARREILYGLPVVPVPVLSRKPIKSKKDIEQLVRPSLLRTANWRDSLAQQAVFSGSRIDMVMKQTDKSELSEGIYIKIEEGDRVKNRLKYVRGDFLQTITDSDSHWHSRPIIQNQLAAGIDIFSYETGVPGAYDDPNFI